MQDLNDLFYFVQVVDHGGFAPAGRALGLQKSKLSRRILLLEERLGVRLLNRSSRRFSITEIGREYYDRCTAMLVEAEAAEQVIAQVRAEPRGIVRVSCPAPTPEAAQIPVRAPREPASIPVRALSTGASSIWTRTLPGPRPARCLSRPVSGFPRSGRSRARPSRSASATPLTWTRRCWPR